MLVDAQALRVALPNLSVKRPFRTAPLIHILHGVDFAIRRGEAVGIVGESGSGKTTLGRALLRLVEPTGGTVRFDGRDITHAPEAALRSLRARMTMIFQNPLSALNPRRTVAASVAAPLVAHGGTGDMRKKVLRALDRAGLRKEFAGRYPHQLSGGQRQRVGIARAIVTEPDFILADEIVSGLDVSTQAQILDLLRDLQAKRGLAIILITHDMGVIAEMAHDVAVMYLGRAVETGPVAEIFESPDHPYTRALLRSIPTVMAKPRTRLPTIAGSIPHPFNRPAGCAYNPRCADVMAGLCDAAEPAPIATDNREVRCFLHGGRP